MPFTPSHAVVALPFVRTPLLPAAIAIGAMTPDLPLFLRGTPLSYQQTHTNVALSTAIALALLVLWYALLRPAVRELAPASVARRLPAQWDATGLAIVRALPPRRPWVRAALVIVSLVIGVLSHIAWDAFTHEGRYGVRLFPALAEQWGPLAGYKWLQHGSSAIALVILAVWAARWMSRRAPAASVPHVLAPIVRRAWWFSLPVILAGAWVIGLLAYGPLTATWTAQHLAYRVLPPACAVWGVLTVAVCVAVIARRSRARRA
ncbi:MAG: DUF4184 family protein [Microbacterium sp.]|uniref:DUF4184 family protein n=1 Tax=Microbacterium sp. TaxID=51671 RepID=UPI001AC4C1D6|nr:DUF4184 family protein [Microbacterium sp.]MBN9178238.1 DUF4184 family protein [Microbacterium sp.]